MFTIAAASASEVFFVIVLRLSLPQSDAAYGQSFAETFGDPFVSVIGGTIAVGCAVVVLPIALFCLQKSNWLRNGFISVGIVFAYIAVATPFSPVLAVFGSPIVAIVALLCSREGRRYQT